MGMHCDCCSLVERGVHENKVRKLLAFYFLFVFVLCTLLSYLSLHSGNLHVFASGNLHVFASGNLHVFANVVFKC